LNTPLQIYKNIIDGLVKIYEGIYRIWVMERGWPKTPENKEINEFISKLSNEDKEIVFQILQEARSSGIHDTLVYFNDRMSVDGLRFVENGVEIPVEPFDTELHYDWVCRREGDEWPDE